MSDESVEEKINYTSHFMTNYFTLCEFANYNDQLVKSLKEEGDFFNRNLILAKIPRKYWDYKWNHIKGDLSNVDANHEGVVVIDNYLNNIEKMYSQGRGLYIYGGHGTSKTTTAIIILRSAMKKNLTAYYLHFHEMVDFLASSWKDEFKKIQWEYITQKIDFLVLDDLARNFKMNDRESIVIDKLFVHRSNNNLPTILTTNLSTEDIGGLLGESIISLFKENVDEVKFIGEDVRKKRFKTDKEVKSDEVEFQPLQPKSKPKTQKVRDFRHPARKKNG